MSIEDSWWRQHPAYEDLLDATGREHTVYLVLVGLKERGWDVLPEQRHTRTAVDLLAEAMALLIIRSDARTNEWCRRTEAWLGASGEGARAWNDVEMMFEMLGSDPLVVGGLAPADGVLDVDRPQAHEADEADLVGPPQDDRHGE